MDDERGYVLSELHAARIAGADDFGRFVSNVESFRPSSLDEPAAMPVLIRLLPTLRDPKVVSAVAGHLRRPWARPTAYEPVHDAFRSWAPREPMGAGWALGDALASAAASQHAAELLVLVQESTYGVARQMLVDSLWRHEAVADVEPVLIDLLNDDDVARHAMSALQRVIGQARMRPHWERLVARTPDSPLGKQAASRLRKLGPPLR